MGIFLTVLSGVVLLVAIVLIAIALFGCDIESETFLILTMGFFFLLLAVFLLECGVYGESLFNDLTKKNFTFTIIETAATTLTVWDLVLYFMSKKSE